jgi:hypothetical protein
MRSRGAPVDFDLLIPLLLDAGTRPPVAIVAFAPRSEKDETRRISYYPFSSRVGAHVVDLATGLRRGELLALRLLVDIDLDAGKVEVRRSLEQTKAGLRLKEPKIEHGRRTLSCRRARSPSCVNTASSSRSSASPLGKPDDTTLLFSEPDGTPTRPNQLSWLWRSACKARSAGRCHSTRCATPMFRR